MSPHPPGTLAHPDAERFRLLLIGHGRGDEFDEIPLLVEADGQLCVLAHRPLVPGPDIFEHPPPDDVVCARQEGDPDQVPPPRLRDPLKRQRLQVDQASEEVPASVQRPELAQGSTQLRVPKQLDHEETQRVRFWGVVGVVHRNDVAPSHLQALVQGSRFPAGPLGRRDVDNPEGVGSGHHVLDQLAGPVRRAVIDDDDLQAV